MRHGTIKASKDYSKESFLDSCLVFEFNVISYNVLSPNHLDCQHGWHGFNRIQNQLMCFNAVGGLQTCETGFWPYISKLRLLRRQNFLRIFSPCVRWVLPAAWPRAAAPEAKHRCMWQPRTATTRSSNCSSRPRWPWMRRIKGAVASGRRIWWRKPLEAMGSLWGKWKVDEMLMAEITFTFSAKCAKAVAPMFGVVFCGQKHRFLDLDLLLKKYFRGSFFMFFFYRTCLLGNNRLARPSRSKKCYFSFRSVYTPMWHPHLWRSHSYKSNQSFLNSFATAAMLRLLHEIAVARRQETKQGDCFQIL